MSLFLLKFFRILRSEMKTQKQGAFYRILESCVPESEEAGPDFKNEMRKMRALGWLARISKKRMGEGFGRILVDSVKGRERERVLGGVLGRGVGRKRSLMVLKGMKGWLGGWEE